MTNEEIIMRTAIEIGMYTQEEAEQKILNFEDLGLHTFADWENRGYIVKRGEHAKVITKLWKHKTKKNVDKEDEKETARFILTNAYLFTSEQVEKA